MRLMSLMFYCVGSVLGGYSISWRRTSLDRVSRVRLSCGAARNAGELPGRKLRDEPDLRHGGKRARPCSESEMPCWHDRGTVALPGQVHAGRHRRRIADYRTRWPGRSRLALRDQRTGRIVSAKRVPRLLQFRATYEAVS